MRRDRKADAIVAQAVGLPALLLVVLFAVVPLVIVGWSSLRAVTFGNVVSGAPEFVGLENYVALMRDPAFRQAVVTSVVFTAVVVAGAYLLGLTAAILIDRMTSFGRIGVFVVLLLPWAMPAVPSALIWRWMFDGIFGIINWGLVYIGILEQPMNWFLDTGPALSTVIVMTIWNLFPIALIMLFAGLQTVPTEHYEAARVDGASPFQEVRHISIPSVRFVSAVVVLLLIIWSFRAVTGIFIMTGGGPRRATETLALFTFNQAFQFNQLATASAAGVITVVLIVALTLAHLYLAHRREAA